MAFSSEPSWGILERAGWGVVGKRVSDWNGWPRQLALLIFSISDDP